MLLCVTSGLCTGRKLEATTQIAFIVEAKWSRTCSQTDRGSNPNLLKMTWTLSYHNFLIKKKRGGGNSFTKECIVDAVGS